MVAPEPKAALSPKPTGKDWAEFLATAPPDSSSEISNLWERYGSSNFKAQTPDVFLYCDSQECAGPRFFEYQSGSLYVKPGEWDFDFLHYRCRNCRKKTKAFALAVTMKGNAGDGIALKVVEIPTFGTHTPARLFKLIGEKDRDLFLQGRHTESRAMGIGAFAYYRRVVDNQKTRIIEEI